MDKKHTHFTSHVFLTKSQQPLPRIKMKAQNYIKCPSPPPRGASSATVPTAQNFFDKKICNDAQTKLV